MMQGRGNIGRPDTPGVSAPEMQRIMDELPREVIAPAFNRLAGQLESQTAAEGLGAKLPGSDAEWPAATPHTVQGVLAALAAKLGFHQGERTNPHHVTAAQVGAYTARETEDAISKRVFATGSADMTRAEYGGSGPGIVKKADDATRLNGHPQTDFAYLRAVQVYGCTFRLDGWKEGSGVWTQDAYCFSMEAEYNTTAPWVYKTGVKATDQKLEDALAQLSGGCLTTAHDYVRATLYEPPPRCDVTIYMRRAIK